MVRNDKVEFGGPASHSRAVIDGDTLEVEFESGHGPYQVDAFNSTFEVHDGGLSRGSVQREVESRSPEAEDKPVPKWDGPVYGVDGLMRNFDY